jgi:hypothetical protein
LQNLDLNIVRAKFDMEGNKNKFFITCAKTGEKIFSSDRLEEIRMTIINNMVLYHPEALEELSSFFSRQEGVGAAAQARSEGRAIGEDGNLPARRRDGHPHHFGNHDRGPSRPHGRHC